MDKKLEKENIETKIKKSLRYSILDASFYSVMVGFGESFFSAFAVFLKATNLQLGLLGSLPQAIGSVLQLWSENIIKTFNSRKKFICISVLLQALTYIPIILVFFLGTFKIYHLILFVCLYFIFGMISSSAWSSWMGDLIDEEERGSYFGKRNTIAGFISFFTLLIAGYVLQRFAGATKTQYIGFAVIFTLALIFRLISLYFLTRKYEPKYISYNGRNISFIEFLRNAKSSNYGKFIIFIGLMNLSIYIAAPFFAAYMLYDLKLNYINYTLVIAAAIISKYISMPMWGKLVDRYGTYKILKLAGFLMPLVSLLWIFSHELSYLILVQVYSGFVWAGFEIASFNFLFDSITPPQRVRYIAYSNVLSGIALLIGAVAGGLIVKYNSVFWSKYMFVFLLSAVFRYIVSIIFIPQLKEIRRVNRITYPRLLLTMVTTMTTDSFIYDIITSRKKRFK